MEHIACYYDWPITDHTTSEVTLFTPKASHFLYGTENDVLFTVWAISIDSWQIYWGIRWIFDVVCEEKPDVTLKLGHPDLNVEIFS